MKNLLEKVGALKTEDGYVMDTPEFIELEAKVLEIEGNMDKTVHSAIDTINLLLARDGR